MFRGVTFSCHSVLHQAQKNGPLLMGRASEANPIKLVHKMWTGHPCFPSCVNLTSWFFWVHRLDADAFGCRRPFIKDMEASVDNCASVLAIPGAPRLGS